jgi:hypothetical protein
MRKFLFKTLCLLIAGVALFVWFRSDASVLAASSALGMDDSSGWLASNSQNSKAFDVLESINVNMLRVNMPWNEIERSAGAYVWAYQTDEGYVDYSQLFARLEKRGIQPVVVLSGGPVYLSHLYPQQPVSSESLLENWKNFVRAAVQQFGSDVKYWQIGTTINDNSAWGSLLFPAATTNPQADPDINLYAEMLKSAYTIIKSGGAGHLVILGDLALGGDCAEHPLFYLQSLNEANAWYAFDIVNVSLPALNDAPENAVVDNCGFSPSQSSGNSLTDPVKAIAEYLDETGGNKSLWVQDLTYDNAYLASKAAERVTMPEVVESDYMTRASGLLLADSGADKVFWNYKPEAGQPAVIALQSYGNLAKTLSANGSQIQLGTSQEFTALRFRNNGRISLLVWRNQGGDEAQALVIPEVSGYKLYGFSADAESLKTSKGIKLNVDAGGSTALLVSERPVLISGRPEDMQKSLSMMVDNSTAQASQGLQAKFNGWMQVQKAKAADKLGNWVAEQQASLLDVLRSSFQQWIRQSLGLAKQ